MATKTLTRSKILDEIHLIREKITKETSNMSPKEEVEYWRQTLHKELNQEGYKTVVSSDGSHTILRK